MYIVHNMKVIDMFFINSILIKVVKDVRIVNLKYSVKKKKLKHKLKK